MSKIMVVIPTFNEIENIERMVKTLLGLPVPGLEVLVVDDNSPDGTGQKVDELVAASGGRVHAMHRAGKQGLGTAYTQGFRWALDQGTDIIVQMDADFSHDPNDVPRLVEAAKNYDVVIGSRYIKGGRLDEQWSIWRRLLSWWANRVWVGFILRTPLKDNTSGFRAWRRSVLIGIDLNRIKSNGYVFQVEVTYLALRMGYTFTEVPIYFQDRRYGTSKMGLKVQMESATGVVRLRSTYQKLTPTDRAAGG